MKLAELRTHAVPGNVTNGDWPDGPPDSHWPDQAPAPPPASFAGT